MSESLAATWRTGVAALASRLPLQRQASETRGGGEGRGGGGHRRERKRLVALALRPAEMRAQHNAATNTLQVLDRRQRLLEASCVGDGASGFVLQGGMTAMPVSSQQNGGRGEGGRGHLREVEIDAHKHALACQRAVRHVGEGGLRSAALSGVGWGWGPG